MSQIYKYFIISAVSIVITLYLFEIYLLNKKNWEIEYKSDIYFKSTGKKYDRRSRFEIYQDLSKKNKEITLSFRSWDSVFSQNDLLPLSGISNSKSINCNENGYYSIFKSDRYGFNNPDYEWDKKETEYLLVGDSFVQGSCVNRPNDLSSLLRKNSNKNVLNIGVAGNGPLKEYATLREYYKNNTKKILWFFFEGYDLADLINEKKSKLLTKYINSENFTQNLKHKQALINKDIKNIFQQEKIRVLDQLEDNKKIKYKLLKFIRLDQTKKFLFRPILSNQINNEVFDDFEIVMRLAKDFSLKNNSDFYFIYLPEHQRYSNKNYSDQNYQKILKIIKKLDIQIIDVKKQVFDKRNNPFKLFPFGEDGHYNELGYRLIANEVFKSTQ